MSDMLALIEKDWSPEARQAAKAARRAKHTADKKADIRYVSRLGPKGRRKLGRKLVRRGFGGLALGYAAAGLATNPARRAEHADRLKNMAEDPKGFARATTVGTIAAAIVPHKATAAYRAATMPHAAKVRVDRAERSHGKMPNVAARGFKKPTVKQRDQNTDFLLRQGNSQRVNKDAVQWLLVEKDWSPEARQAAKRARNGKQKGNASKRRMLNTALWTGVVAGGGLVALDSEGRAKAKDYYGQRQAMRDAFTAEELKTRSKAKGHKNVVDVGWSNAASRQNSKALPAGR